ncbi:DUF5403 family protein [Sciscionella sediminilitoris]|uniref:DUF5403 family protein n=1 Tax=Sciscionella sediminilitoris TaxID=1445613 RepID=UPI0006922AD3|nr:DUF5403 family protein [Sciscionella sp. SE31]
MISSKRANKIVAQIARPAVAEVALEIGVKAERLLAEHHRSGEHRIEVDQNRVDAYVSLVGPAAAAIELGHFAGYKGERSKVEGLHVLTRAAGLRE